MISPNEYQDCKDYIHHYWKSLVCRTPKDRDLVIGLPNRYICPSKKEFDNKMYYWDSYFIILGLLIENRIELAKGMAENLFYLFNRFGFIPQSNRFYHLGKSNPPFLTSIISELYSQMGDRRWLRKAVKTAEMEYHKVWMGTNRLTDNGLSRYWEPTYAHEQAEDESGWDRTSRFFDRCLNINPIDLNCLLYKYEIDLTYLNLLMNRKERAQLWKTRSLKRKALINKYLWDDRRGFFFDYDFVVGRRTKSWSLAGFYPLWSGLANIEQADRLRNNLAKFEAVGGLSTTRKVYIKKTHRQWDYPTGWANLHWIVIKGLLEYDFYDAAERIAEKWIRTCATVFRKTNLFWEKYDVTKIQPSFIGRYDTQTGFGWTNSVFVKILDEFA